MRFCAQLPKFAAVLLLAGFEIAANSQSYLPGLNQPGSYETGSAYEFATSPSMAAYDGDLYIAYGSNDGNNYLRVIKSSDGVSWSTPPTWTSQLAAGTAPSIASWNGYLWMAWIAQGGGLTDGAVYLSYSNNPTSGWSSPVAVTTTGSPDQANSSPTLAVFNNELWIAWVYNYSGSATDINTFSTTNGSTFSSESVCGDNDPSGDMPQIGAAVALASNDKLMWYAYQTQGGAGGHTLRVCSWNRVKADAPTYYSPGQQVGGGVNAVSNGEAVFFTYKDYNSHDLIVTGTENGSSFETGPYTGIQINGNQEINPCPAIFNNLFYVAYTQNGGDHYMYWTEN